MTVVPLRTESPANRGEGALMRLQRAQQAHDEVAHRDILSFNLHTRLKHMVLHFFKYAGNIETARASGDLATLQRVLVDALIICLASANGLNLSLEKALGGDTGLESLDPSSATSGLDDPFRSAVSKLVLLGGQMAKAMESLDHMEAGDPRATMNALVPQLTAEVLMLLKDIGARDIERKVLARLRAVEERSIFAAPK